MEKEISTKRLVTCEGKAGVISKGRIMSRRKRKLDNLLTSHQRDIVKLSKVSFPGDEDSETLRKSVISQFNRNGHLTAKQWHCAKQLISRARRNRRTLRCPNGYFVYAMLAGGKLKIGFSNDPKRRARDMQTGNADEVKILATIKCPTINEAKELEKYIHAEAEEFRIRGEWFRPEAIEYFEGAR